MTQDTVDVSVVVVNYNTAHLLPEMFSTLYGSRDGLKLQVIVVDNASHDGSAEVLRRDFPEAHLIVNSTNVGFGRANNQAIPYLKGRYVLLLNTDAFMAPDTLSKTVDYMEAHPDCGVLGVRLTDRDGCLQPSCRYAPRPLNVFVARTGLKRFFPGLKMVDDMAWDHASVRECDWVPGCYYLVRREVVDRVGLFDPRYFLYYEEVDHCRAVQRDGWKVIFYPHTSVVHIGGESAKSVSEITAKGRQISALQIESELLFFRKHFGALGLASSLFLSLVGDGVITLKALLKGKGADVASMWKATATRWKLVRKTRFGTCPTR